MTKQRVLLIGATGETGNSILEGLLDQPSLFDVETLIRPTSAEKSSTKKLAQRGVPIRLADINGPVEDLITVLEGVDIVICSVDVRVLLDQKNLATAAKEAGVKRFVPTMFGVITPPGGVQPLRDDKEQVIQHIRKLFLPYTFIDVGWWYQAALPTLPSGKLNHAIFMKDKAMHGDGTVPSLHIDLRDVGRFVAHIVADDRTLNKYVIAWGEELTENQLWSTTEEIMGEKIPRKYQSREETLAVIKSKENALASDPTDTRNMLVAAAARYEASVFLDGHNSLAYAKYFGYINARELYPDFQPTTYREYLTSLREGKVAIPYQSDSGIGSVFTGRVEG